jgi:hypothetical protein
MTSDDLAETNGVRVSAFGLWHDLVSIPSMGCATIACPLAETIHGHCRERIDEMSNDPWTLIVS